MMIWFLIYGLGALCWAGYCLFKAGTLKGSFSSTDWVGAGLLCIIWFVAAPGYGMIKLGEHYRDQQNRNRNRGRTRPF